VCMVVPKYLRVLTMELAARHLYGTWHGGSPIFAKSVYSWCKSTQFQLLLSTHVKLLQFMLSNNEKLYTAQKWRQQAWKQW